MVESLSFTVIISSSSFRAAMFDFDFACSTSCDLAVNEVRRLAIPDERRINRHSNQRPKTK